MLQVQTETYKSNYRTRKRLTIVEEEAYLLLSLLTRAADVNAVLTNVGAVQCAETAGSIQ